VLTKIKKRANESAECRETRQASKLQIKKKSVQINLLNVEKKG